MRILLMGITSFVPNRHCLIKDNFIETDETLSQAALGRLQRRQEGAHGPALPAGIPPVPVALRRFTARFGMVRRGSGALNTRLHSSRCCCLTILYID